MVTKYFFFGVLMREQVASLLWTFASASTFYYAWNEYTQYKSIKPKTLEEVEIKQNHVFDALDFTFLGVSAAVQIPPADYLPKTGFLRAPVAGFRLAMLGTFAAVATMRVYKDAKVLFGEGKDDKTA